MLSNLKKKKKHFLSEKEMYISSFKYNFKISQMPNVLITHKQHIEIQEHARNSLNLSHIYNICFKG